MPVDPRLKWPLQTLDFGAVLGGKKEGRIRMPAKQNTAPRLTKMDQYPFYVPFSLVRSQYYVLIHLKCLNNFLS